MLKPLEGTLGDIVRPGTTRGLDFVTLDELRKRTSVNPESVIRFCLSEMLCNALDKDATEIHIGVHIEGDFCRVEVSDNGSKKLSLEEIKLLLDFENKASSKRGFLRVSRGYLGNALKCSFGYSYALAESKRLVPPDIIVKSAGFEHRISLKPDRTKEIIKSEIATKKIEDDGFTTFVVDFPKDETTAESSNTLALKDLVLATCMVNPTRRICYNIFGVQEGTLGIAQQGRGIRQETSILWYTRKQFQSLVEDFLRARPEIQLKEFIPLFRGFTSKKVMGEILQNLNLSNHDCQGTNSVQFFPATPIKDLSVENVGKLFAVMKAKAKPISKRSIGSVLGLVGEESLQNVSEQNGWERLRYVAIPAVKVQCPRPDHSDGPCLNEDHVELPYLIELAIFDRKNDDQEGLKVYQCVNFMASTEDIFARLYPIDYHLGRACISRDMPVTVVAHLVCPVLNWLNYGKTDLFE